MAPLALRVVAEAREPVAHWVPRRSAPLASTPTAERMVAALSRGWRGLHALSIEAAAGLAHAQRWVGDGLADRWPRDHRPLRPGRDTLHAVAQRAADALVAGTRRLALALRARWLLVAAALVVALTCLAVVPHVVASIRWTAQLVPPAATMSAGADAPVVIHAPPTPPASATLSPAQPYLVGAWMADDLPLPTAADTIYVRVTVGASHRPAAGVSVTATVAYTCASRAAVRAYGPAVTDADGLAAIPIQFAGLPVGQPVCVVVTAKTGAGAFTSTTGFAASAGPMPTPSPSASPTSPTGGGRKP